ncbi:MAG: beta-aspartyl-peptidase [Bacteroides sp.]|nr:beta-aspartyl-peptidase [Bacteroides sp.]
MKLRILKNANLYAPEKLGIKDILICDGKIAAIGEKMELSGIPYSVTDVQGAIVTPGFIDQHVHIIGAGGKSGYFSIAPEVQPEELIACGTTTVVGMLGTDGITKELTTLHAKCKSLEQYGLGAYMLTSYFAVPPKTIMKSVTEDMLFIDKIIGCKVAISDERSSFPTSHELLRLINQVHLGGLTSGKGGVLHIHLGALASRMEVLLELARTYPTLISHISPTHVGRTRDLFEEAIEFAKLGGSIDISTGGTKYDDPYKTLLYGLEKGVPLQRITFSSDGNAGLSRKDPETGATIFYKAPLQLNLEQVQKLIRGGGLPIEDAIRPVTTNSAANMKLRTKGSVKPGYDADFCLFTPDMQLQGVIAGGTTWIENGELIKKGNFS